MNTPFNRFIPVADWAEAVWSDLINFRDAVHHAEYQWEHISRRCRRLVRKGARITGRPRPDQELGKVELWYGGDEAMVHVAVMEDGEHQDTIRFPLDWLGPHQHLWRALLRIEHQKAIVAGLIRDGDTERAARLSGRKTVHVAGLDGRSWRTACGREVGVVDRDDLGFTEDQVSCRVCLGAGSRG